MSFRHGRRDRPDRHGRRRPGQGEARLSHALKGDPQLCVVQTADSSASAVVSFSTKVKDAVTRLQTDGSRSQQAAQATAALRAGAQAAAGTASKQAPAGADDLVAAITAQGIYARKAASLAAVTETGTLYVVSDRTTTKTATLALMDTKKVVHTATQGVSGSPKLATAKEAAARDARRPSPARSARRSHRVRLEASAAGRRPRSRRSSSPSG